MTAAPAADLDRRFHAFAVDRALAWTIDGGAIYLAWRQLDAAAAVAAGVAVVLVVFSVATVLLGRTGSSPGGALLGVRVLAADGGGPIGAGRAVRRQVVLGLATLPTLGLGTAMLAWTAAADPSGRRRAWHDLLVGSEVVDVRPVPAEPAPEPEPPRGVVNLTALHLVPAGAPRAPEPDPAASSPAPPAASSSPPTPRRRSPQHRAPDPAPAAVPPSPAPPPRQRLGHPLLPEASARWRIGFDSGESLVVEGPVLVGRRPEPRAGEVARTLLALPSADMSLSKTHASVQVAADGALVVTDRGSTNGSVLLRGGVARDLPPGRPTTLLEDDHVRLGDRIMTVVREP
ncbi:RDD family protein [Nocardioides sp.]|uniref:RDD family protein n=1 Tax=Nocardioides sp. TaxID=35761 RepID=UPI003784C378